jgi:hypothetical protein
MSASSKYWNMLIISGCDPGYKTKEIMSAKNYFLTLFPDLAQTPELSTEDDKNIQSQLHQIFIYGHEEEQINAGFCLRCSISYSILKACKDLVKKFGKQYNFILCDILGIVLQDDGIEQIILGDDGQTQILINSNSSQIITEESQRFPVEILAKFNVKKGGLDNWAYYKAHRNDDLMEHLRIAYHLIISTPWAILNRVNNKKLQGQSKRNKHLIDVYHQIYRSDRRQNKQYQRCSEPSESQLLRMTNLLKEREIIINNPEQLIEELKQLAEYFKEIKINPLILNQYEHHDPTPLQQFLEPHVMEILEKAIALTFSQSINQLKNSPKYKKMLDKFIPSYQLLYLHKMTLGQIAKQLGFTGQPQASRVLKPEFFIHQVGNYIYDQMLIILGEFVRSKRGIIDNPDLLQGISQEVNDYIFEKVTSPALNELRSGGRPPQRNSLFAEKMRCYFNNYQGE